MKFQSILTGGTIYSKKCQIRNEALNFLNAKGRNDIDELYLSRQHGRVKVKTTAQQQEEKRIERQKKLAFYQAATDRIFQKRSGSELDDELLQMTAQVLLSNPDDSTLWNIRREVFLDFKQKGEDVDARAKDELYLTQCALMKNPKSYGAWWHRGWTNCNLPNEANWKKELELTGQFLEKDDRNFHCWDYRRYVLEKFPVPLEDELKFTKEKIDANFSNYSSWHYRSRLLFQLFPQGDTITENALFEELDLVFNAAFTDPQDQSAWMYHRWLLGQAQSGGDLVSVKLYPSEGKLLLTFNKAKKQCNAKIQAAEKPLENAPWKSVGGQPSAFVWECQSDELKNVDILVNSDLKLTPESPEWVSPDFRGRNLTPDKISVLEQQLEFAKQLTDVEPDSKWALLATALLMKALQNDKYHETTLNLLEKVKELDPFHRNYYSDLKSKMIIEQKLEPNQIDVDLSSLGLSCLHNCHLLAATETLNLAGNQLTSDFLKQLRHCANLKVIILDKNPIGNLDFARLIPSLKEISLKECDIGEVSQIDGVKIVN